jgi:peroxiredoxin Q/BCP
MTLAIGDQAPDFILLDQHGDAVSLSALRGRTIVLYFYPKAGTSMRKKQYRREAALRA